MSRHLLSLFLGALTAVICFTATPDQPHAQDRAPAKPAKVQMPALPDLVVPSAETIVIMIRHTLISLDAAMQTGNFTVLRDLAAPSFREANSAGRLYQVFANLQAQRISLASVAILVPKLPQPPSIQPDGRLHIAGSFPGDPVQIDFELIYETVAGNWRLFGLAVAPVKSQSADAPPAAENRGKPAPEPKSRKWVRPMSPDASGISFSLSPNRGSAKFSTKSQSSAPERYPPRAAEERQPTHMANIFDVDAPMCLDLELSGAVSSPVPGNVLSTGMPMAGEASPPLAPIIGDTTTLSTITGTNGNDELLGTSGDDTMICLDGNDNANGGAGADIIDGGAGIDTLHGGLGDDTLIGGNGGDFLFGEQGDDDLRGDFGDDLLAGGAGMDTLEGGAGNDRIFGGNDADTLYGGGDNDTLDGGAAGDLFFGGDGFDTVTFANSTVGITLNRTDWLRSTGEARGDLYVGIEAFDLTASNDVYIAGDSGYVVNGKAGNDTLNGGTAGDTLLGDVGNDILFGNGGSDGLFGDAGDDTLFGGDESDALYGGIGSDSLDGGAGDDFLMGAAGGDALSGGDGFDIASYEDSIVSVSISLSQSSATWSGIAQGDSFNSIEQIRLSSFADSFTGDADANGVSGGDGEDQISGLGGDDALYGGNDNDVLYGGSGNDTLFGEQGFDVLSGGDGDDVLYAGGAALAGDVLDGGGGNDTLFGSQQADTISGGDGTDTASYAQSSMSVSIDLGQASSAWTGSAKGDNLTSIEEFVLSQLDDSFRGDGSGNAVQGGAGNDDIFGLGGKDSLSGDGGDDFLYGGDGDDWMEGDSVWGSFSGLDYMLGGSGDDIMFGREGADRMYGGTGNDILSGGHGKDFLSGGAGADVFLYTTIDESRFDPTDISKNQDQIVDFTQGEDLIDLSAIDADSLLAGDQAFTLLADPASHTGDWSGLVWATTNSRGVTTIYASTDADGDAEMQIFMTHSYVFTGGDFIL